MSITSITPARLLALSAVTFGSFCIWQTVATPRTKVVRLRMPDGELVTTVRSHRFTLPPLMAVNAPAPTHLGAPASRTGNTLRQPPRHVLPPASVACPGPREASLTAASTANRNGLRMAPARLLDDAPAMVMAALPAPRVEAPIAPAATEPAAAPQPPAPPVVVAAPQPSAPPIVMAAAPAPAPEPPAPKVAAAPAPPSTDRVRTALASARRLWKNNPERAVALLMPLADGLDSTGRIDERADVAYWLGKALRSADRGRECVTEFRRAAELVPDRAQYVNGLAWTLLTVDPVSLRRPDEALTLARRAVELTNQGDANYLDTLARALFMVGDGTGACAVQRAAVELEPDNRNYERRLRSYEEAGSAD